MKKIFPLIFIFILVTSCISRTPVIAMNPAIQSLLPDAQKEGTLVLIGQPRDWCNYGELMDAFEGSFGIEIQSLNPDATSEQRIASMSGDSKKNPPPDVIDVGFAFVESAQADGILAPYKVSTWKSIPSNLKDPDGYWTGGYYGVISFLVNTRIQAGIPRDWADLLNEKYKNRVSFYGDPRSSNQAVQSVFAASLANGGSLEDAKPGLQFFDKLNQKGNLVPLIANPLLVARGDTPVLIAWDQYTHTMKDSFAGNPPAKIVIPEHGRIGNLYVQAINAHAQHPATAKLWMEFLYSDEGQELWRKGYCHPVRETDLQAQGRIPQIELKNFPNVSDVIFPSTNQLQKAREVVVNGWDSVVGVNIQPAP